MVKYNVWEGMKFKIHLVWDIDCAEAKPSQIPYALSMGFFWDDLPLSDANPPGITLLTNIPKSLSATSSPLPPTILIPDR